ncbi:helix-turn-helix transcriptional regulator [Paracoccus alkanivorans]|uniref:AraC family transcriptional regulator n=1 Tax=Paracoccus alkanivorans TaxID=2116655 RepID=A0A3M0MA68_9RHOB|nr:AraC family transcriptional regulator [Paracoccus alkanivorans]RMC32470.1 AraC family transcriptional regulator [Paracoccus alkanivorans]
MRQTVQDFLGHSRFAHTLARLDLGAGRAVTIWENHDDRMVYDAPLGHTFSYYLDGGTGTRRLDAGAIHGWPGAICVMPEGHRSEWEITTSFRFVHLYMPDAELRAAYAMTHDCDARRLDMREDTFADIPAMSGPLGHLARAADMGETLLADTALAELIAHLPSRQINLRGGLAPHVLRRVDEWIEANLDSSIRLADLARIAGLSEFHFHRMFRMSRGISPHGWITTRRIELAKELLRTPTPIAEIAAGCGFASQSHLARMFRNHTGSTPKEYRAAYRYDGPARSRNRR